MTPPGGLPAAAGEQPIARTLAATGGWLVAASTDGPGSPPHCDALFARAGCVEAPVTRAT
jgi:hypothetical protein